MLAPLDLIKVADCEKRGPQAAPGALLTCQHLAPADSATVAWLRWGFHASRFGPVLAATSARGLCWLGFVLTDLSAAQQRLAAAWPDAHLMEDPDATRAAVDLAFNGIPPSQPLALLLRGTAFQYAVWEILLRIPVGTAVSYGAVATAIGHPTAVRAVGGAVGANPISVLVPCHRVIRKSGALHQYAWGVERKRALLQWEGVCA